MGSWYSRCYSSLIVILVALISNITISYYWYKTLTTIKSVLSITRSYITY